MDALKNNIVTLTKVNWPVKKRISKNRFLSNLMKNKFDLNDKKLLCTKYANLQSTCL